MVSEVASRRFGLAQNACRGEMIAIRDALQSHAAVAMPASTPYPPVADLHV
jgi:hypothetical protein